MTAVPDGLAGSWCIGWDQRVSVLVVHAAQSSSSARSAFHGVRAQSHDLHTKNIASLAFLRMCVRRDRADRMVASMN
ncbi:hypothetical protein FJ964_09645 [Mesorhizobium sp. B2-3-2]|nr:hypothetical protein FJ964_09645 [Mesorhizobium sp. B2-3-2]